MLLKVLKFIATFIVIFFIPAVAMYYCSKPPVKTAIEKPRTRDEKINSLFDSTGQCDLMNAHIMGHCVGFTHLQTTKVLFIDKDEMLSFVEDKIPEGVDWGIIDTSDDFIYVHTLYSVKHSNGSVSVRNAEALIDIDTYCFEYFKILY